MEQFIGIAFAQFRPNRLELAHTLMHLTSHLVFACWQGVGSGCLLETCGRSSLPLTALKRVPARE